MSFDTHYDRKGETIKYIQIENNVQHSIPMTTIISSQKAVSLYEALNKYPGENLLNIAEEIHILWHNFHLLYLIKHLPV